MKKVRKRVRIKGVLVILLFLYLIGMFIYYIITMPIKNIIVNNNNKISSEEIIKTSKIAIGQSIFKVSTYSAKKNIEKMPFIKHAKITRDLFGNITINVIENKIVFYNAYNNKIVLSDATEIDNDTSYYGFPTLINYVPSDIYSKLISSLGNVSDDILKMISEIEYSVNKYEDTIIDDERFLLRMKDGNTVYINIINFDKINKYQEIYVKLTDKGILYLDSDSKNHVFKKYGTSDNIEPEEENNED